MLLKRKILIKNKRLKPEDEKQQLEKFLKEGKVEEDIEEAENPDIIAPEFLPQEGRLLFTRKPFFKEYHQGEQLQLHVNYLFHFLALNIARSYYQRRHR